MKNPWLMKNPFLSIWLSTANSMFGWMRGHALNEAHRQQQALITESARYWMSFWSAGALEPAAKRKRRSR
jgi:hypothetical protein